MAKCPHCDYKLKPWNIKAECPSCGANIPNYNWEVRLEEDAQRSEKAFALLRERKVNFKAVLFGSKLRILRFVFTFLPLILLLIPLLNAYINLPFVSGSANISILSTILWIVSNSLDFGSVLSLTGSAVLGSAVKFLFASLISFLLAFVIAVISFFMLMISAPGLGSRANIICNALSVLLSIASVITLSNALEQFAGSGINFMSETSLGIGLFIAIVIYAVNLALNIAADGGLVKDRKAFRKRRAESKLD